MLILLEIYDDYIYNLLFYTRSHVLLLKFEWSMVNILEPSFHMLIVFIIVYCYAYVHMPIDGLCFL